VGKRCTPFQKNRDAILKEQEAERELRLEQRRANAPKLEGVTLRDLAVGPQDATIYTKSLERDGSLSAILVMVSGVGDGSVRLSLFLNDRFIGAQNLIEGQQQISAPIQSLQTGDTVTVTASCETERILSMLAISYFLSGRSA
jgi:hypothetical protein